jgi:hypothetical protein
MTEARETTARWWRSRRLRLFILIGVLTTLVVMVGLDLWTGHLVDTEVARLESQYDSLDPGAAQGASVPAAANRARAVRAAAALANHGAADQASVGASLGQFKRRSEPAPVPDDLRAFVQANSSALRIADEARARQQGDWEVDYVSGTNMPPLLDLRTLSNAIYVAACLEIEAGRPDDATRILASGLAVAASLSDEPALIVQLIRIAVALIQFDAVEELITHADPSETALADLARWLRENRQADPIWVGLLGELRYFNAAFTTLDDGRGARMHLAQGSFWSGPHRRIGRPFLRLAWASYLRRMGALLEAQAGPRPLQPFDAATRSGWLERSLPAVGPGLGPALEQAMESGDLFMSALGATEVGVALRRYRLDRGEYPDDLSALVPEYLARLPIDPFTGLPPVYARRGAGFIVTGQAGSVDPANYSALEWTVLR